MIAAVNGTCAGGGLHFLADADVVIAATHARFIDPHVSVGQVSAFEAIGLARRMPAEAVFRMVLTGRHGTLDAAGAHQVGLVGQVVDPPARLRDEAAAVAERIARTPPDVLATIKRAVWAAIEGAAELLAKQFAGVVAGELVDDRERDRHLVRGEVLAAQPFQRRRVAGCARGGGR